MSVGARLGRQVRISIAVAGIVAAALGAAFVPAPPGLVEPGAARPLAFAAIASAAIVALSILPFSMRRHGSQRRVWIAIAATALAAGLASYSFSAARTRACTARYAGRVVIAGTELTPLGVKYTEANPDQPRDELLFDAAGDVSKVWTRASIDRCRTIIGATYYLWIPFLVVCLLAAVQAMPAGAIAAGAGAAPVTPPPAPEIRYDAFVSYRHGGADGEVARELLDTLEADGYRIAIDERDFPANASFLEEMERCIRESRFTIAIISARYLESGNCQEEAIVCKVLDMDARRRRLIPFVIESVPMPAWLYGLVGIYTTKAEPLVDPVEKLKATLGTPMARGRASSALTVP